MKKRLLAVILASITALVPLTASASVQNTSDIAKAGFENLDSTTEKNPFVKMVGNSKKFRIPAFTVLNDGSLFACADARYTTTGDGGGLDTLVALSNDKGETWSQSFAINYPDSDGFADLISTTCIDPAVVEASDGTIFVIADMNPTGVTTKPEYISPNKGTGYVNVNGTFRLALTDDYQMVNSNPSENNYPYYLGDLENGYSFVLNSKDNSKTKWVLDEWWNIYEINENGEYVPLTQKQVNSDKDVMQNAFYKDSVLHVYNTGYLLMVSSKDKGKTWTPQVLNPQIKRDSEEALLVSPGKGTVAQDGTIIVPFYTFNRTEEKVIQQASFIYSKDNGKSWKRSVNAPNGNGIEWSSESEIVEVYDGVLRMFIRNGTGKIAYIDAKWDDSLNDYTWSNPVVTDVEVWSNCNLSAVTYSKEIDGKKAVMVACPSGKKRTVGKIYTFLVNEDNTMTPTYSYRINSGDYAYSCMDELDDGTIGVLYEAKPGTMKYKNYDLETLTKYGLDYDTKAITIASVVGGSVAVVALAGLGVVLFKKFKKKK